MDVTLHPAYDSRDEILSLFTEYTDMLLAEAPAFRVYLDLQNYGKELRHPERKYGPPEGRLYLARCGGAPAGCIALRKLDETSCEMKRLYVRPTFRGHRIGSLLIRQVITDAREIGYRSLLLDTLPFLESAIRLYRQFGFYGIPCYNDSPLEQTLFLRLDL